MSTSFLIESPGTLRPMLRLTLPVLVEQVLHMLVGFTDMWLTGNLLSEAYVAAMTLMMYALWLVANVFAFVAVGSTAMTARFVGAGDRAVANRVMNQSVTSGLIWSALLMAACLPAVDAFVSVMGLEGTAADAAREYLKIELCVLPAVMMERVGIACLRGAGDMVSGLVIMGIVNLINMGMSYSLATGLGPLPELGWRGIALGTAIGHVSGATIILLLLVFGRAGFHLRLSLMRPDFDMIRRILRIGVPGGLDTLSVTVCHMFYLRLILGLGNLAAAAHGVAIQVEALAFMPGAAFQISAATLAGQYLGAGDPHRAHRSVLAACAVAMTIMVGAGAIFYWAATPLASFFLGGQSEEVVPLAARLLRIIAFVMPPLAVMMVLIGALRGAGDTRWPLAITLVGFLLVRLPLVAYLAQTTWTLPLVGIAIPGLGLGVVGAWYAAIVDVTLRSVLLAWRFFHGGWKKVEV
jgi:putative MATE family efflux protein